MIYRYILFVKSLCLFYLKVVFDICMLIQNVNKDKLDMFYDHHIISVFVYVVIQNQRNSNVVLLLYRVLCITLFYMSFMNVNFIKKS